MSTVARFTVRQYDRMIETGILDSTERRIELIHGELREMSPIGDLHAYIVAWLVRWSIRSLPFDEVWINPQNPVGMADLDSVPEPDLAWLRLRDYRRHRPTPGDVLLLIEVSDSSLQYDRELKGPLYAQAGIQEYWIVNLPEETIEVYRQPRGDRYGNMTTLRRGDVARSLAFPDVALALDELFGDSA